MNTKFQGRSSKAGNRAGSTAVRVRTIRAWAFLVMVVALMSCGCGSTNSTTSSFLYLEPSTQTNVPQVRGSLHNLGHQTLVMVEFTLSFKDRRNQIIFDETAYPICVSALSRAQGNKPLAPGEHVKFAFKSPACPKAWQPGQVDVRVTKGTVIENRLVTDLPLSRRNWDDLLGPCGWRPG